MKSFPSRFQSSSTSSQDDEKSTLEEVSEGAIPIDQPSLGPSTPGSQGPELPFQSHSQSQGPGLNKSSSSPELQTLPEAFSKANMRSESMQGEDSRPRAPSDGKPPAQQPHVEKDKVKGSTGGDVNGLGCQNQAGEGAGPSSQSGGLRLAFPPVPAQSGPISPGGGHRPRGHTISVSAPSSRRERRTERDSYHNRPGPSNTEKMSGLSPRYSTLCTDRCLPFWEDFCPVRDGTSEALKLVSFLMGEHRNTATAKKNMLNVGLMVKRFSSNMTGLCSFLWGWLQNFLFLTIEVYVVMELFKTQIYGVFQKIH